MREEYSHPARPGWGCCYWQELEMWKLSLMGAFKPLDWVGSSLSEGGGVENISFGLQVLCSTFWLKRNGLPMAFWSYQLILLKRGELEVVLHIDLNLICHFIWLQGVLVY